MARISRMLARLNRKHRWVINGEYRRLDQRLRERLLPMLRATRMAYSRLDLAGATIPPPSSRATDPELRRRVRERKQAFTRLMEQAGRGRHDFEVMNRVLRNSWLGPLEEDVFGAPPVDEGEEFTHKVQLKLCLVHQDEFKGISHRNLQLGPIMSDPSGLVAAEQVPLATSVTCSTGTRYVDEIVEGAGGVLQIGYELRSAEDMDAEIVLKVPDNLALLNAMLLGCSNLTLRQIHPSGDVEISCHAPARRSDRRHLVRVVFKVAEHQLRYSGLFYVRALEMDAGAKRMRFSLRRWRWSISTSDS